MVWVEAARWARRGERAALVREHVAHTGRNPGLPGDPLRGPRAPALAPYDPRGVA